MKPETRSGEEATVEGLKREAEELWSNPLRFITFPPAPSTDALQDTHTQTHTNGLKLWREKTNHCRTEPCFLNYGNIYAEDLGSH